MTVLCADGQVVTTEETDDLMLETMGLVIHAYHYDIVSLLHSPYSSLEQSGGGEGSWQIDDGELYDISWLLPFARAVREVRPALLYRFARMLMGQRVYGGEGQAWDDEYA